MRGLAVMMLLLSGCAATPTCHVVCDDCKHLELTCPTPRPSVNGLIMPVLR